MSTEPIFDSLHTIPTKLEISFLDSKKTFEQLTNNEKLYAYILFRASWAGVPIVAKQTSKESYPIIKLFLDIFKNINVYTLDKTNPNMDHFINYVAYVMGENGNYASFGDTKMVPRMKPEEMREIMTTYFSAYLLRYLDLEDKIFSLNESEKLLGYYPDNTTTYFSSNMSETDAKIVDDYVSFKKLEGWNTRAKKYDNSEKILKWLNINKCDTSFVPSTLYLIKIASVTKPKDQNIKMEKYNDSYFILDYGDFSDELEKIKMWIKGAAMCCDSDVRKQMLEYYHRHFKYGDIVDHKKSQIYWVADKMPSVETNIGFIENYRDPSGIRATFQSFVAMVDKEKTKKFQRLVKQAPKFLLYLPWPREFEKDTFSAPDFTSLDVLTFVGSGIPSGINIPNYDDIRQNHGFKNVSLDNIITSNYVQTELPKYLVESDGILYNKYGKQSFAIDVAGHELLGHGSGKLFVENLDGTFNFDKNTINPITGLPVDKWYRPNETWSYKFSKISSAYEECRAECVGLLLSNFKEMHDIFEYAESEWKDICYVSWLWMVRTGLISTLAYNPERKMWSQAHSQARYVIYRVLKETGMVHIELKDQTFIIHVDRNKIETHGLPALKNFLMKLNVYKSTADVENGSKLFLHYSQVDDSDLKLRSIHLKEKKPRTIFIQPTLKLVDDGYETKIIYHGYDNSPEDLIQSYVDKMNITLV